MRESSGVFAIVPAAGLGRRIRQTVEGDKGAAGEGNTGVAKQLRDLDGEPMLVRVLDALEPSNVKGVVVVVNPIVASTIQRLRPAGDHRRYRVNDRPESEMIESIQIGLRAAIDWSDEASSGTSPKGSACGYLICPGDHPCIGERVIDRCIAAFAMNRDRITLATYQRRRGHPMILPGELAGEVLSWPASRGLNELRREHPDRVIEIEIEDPSVVIDVDTPADLEEARALLEQARKRERGGSE